jgi:cell division protein FtsL
MEEEGGMKRGTPVIRTALLFAFLLGSLTLVVWRQSRALAVLREMEAVRHERVLEEARRSALHRRVEQLESRARVSEVARDRFGMRLPSGEEIVILPLRDPVPPALAVGGSGPGAGEG